MQTKFKKGDPVVVVSLKSRLFGWTGIVDENGSTVPWVIWDNGQPRSAIHESLIEIQGSIPADLADGERMGTIATPSPRLASDMTIRERFAISALKTLLVMYPINEAIKASVQAADALINALNEKP